MGAFIELLNNELLYQGNFKENEKPYPCILSLSDSSSMVSWLAKSNHDPNSSPVHGMIVRWHTRNLIDFDAYNYLQHIKGLENILSDCLSSDFYLSDRKILSLLQTVSPHLIPSNPQIISLSNQISSWITTLV